MIIVFSVFDTRQIIKFTHEIEIIASVSIKIVFHEGKFSLIQ